MTNNQGLGVWERTATITLKIPWIQYSLKNTFSWWWYSKFPTTPIVSSRDNQPAPLVRITVVFLLEVQWETVSRTVCVCVHVCMRVSAGCGPSLEAACSPVVRLITFTAEGLVQSLIRNYIPQNHGLAKGKKKWSLFIYILGYLCNEWTHCQNCQRERLSSLLLIFGVQYYKNISDGLM